MGRLFQSCTMLLVTIRVIDRLEFRVDLLKGMHQAGIEMLRKSSTVAAGDDLGGAGVSETVLVRTRTAQCVVNVDQVHQPCRFRDVTPSKSEGIAAAVPVLVMSQSDLACHLQQR